MTDSMTDTRSRILGAVLLVVGWLVVAWALTAAYDAPWATYTGSPECDGRAMRPGDVCISTGSNNGTYEEIVARRKANAKANAWNTVEAAGFVGAGLVYAGAAVAGVVGRLREPLRTSLVLGAGTVPMLGVAAALWPLQARVEAASPVPIGLLGLPAAAVTAALVVFALSSYLAALWDGPQQEDAPHGGALPPTGEEVEARRTAASAAFDLGESDDPWAARRITKPRPAHYPVFAVRGVQAMGVLVFAASCLLAVALRAGAADLPGWLPALGAGAGGLLFTVHGLRFPHRGGGPVRRGYAVAAVSALAVAAGELTSLSAVTWPGLLNAMAFSAAFWTLASWFGTTLPNAPVAGRVVYTLLGLTQLQTAAVVVSAASASASSVVSEVAAYVTGAVVFAWAGRSFDRASKAEALGAVPPTVSVTCLAASSVLLAVTAYRTAVGGSGWFVWAVAAGCALVGAVQAHAAAARVGAADRSSPSGSG
ncbi:hypothetical protein OG753_37130 [Streptomyces sp. NBC_00029]|uniref:hypothetical protein n=1 Tax=Streptomyces sp. NBC_00029 TaxID=2903613 RepID=UPI003253C179